MVHTSNNRFQPSVPAQNVFFTPYQLIAFAKAPDESVVAEVAIGGGGKADYLYIGPGLWELSFQHLETRVENTFKGSGTAKKPWLGISATVKTTLVIFARDGSDRRLRYEAITAGKDMSDPERGSADGIDKAIKSAETDGIKRAAQNLGRAFGLDLKGKVARNAMPPSLREIEAMILSKQSENSQDSLPAPEAEASSPVMIAAAPAAEKAPAEREPVEQRSEDRRVETPRQDPTPEKVRAVEAPAKAAEPKPVAAKAAEKPVEQPKQVATAKQADVAVDAPEAEHDARAKSEAESTEQVQDPAPEQPKAAVEWELMMPPKNFQDWLLCLQTMAGRVEAMISVRELEAFLTRHKKRIKDLPVLPAEEGRSEKNFKARWSKIVAAKYVSLGAEMPAEYADFAPTAQAA
jgi:hypothetical protein